MAAVKGKGLDSVQDSLVELSLSGRRERTWAEQTCLGGIQEVSLVEQDLFDLSVEQQTSVAASEDSVAEQDECWKHIQITTQDTYNQL